MIDVLTENLIDPKAATRLPVFRHPRTGKPASLAKVYRAMTEGCRARNGQKIPLDHVRVPGGTRTSLEAITRFVAALSGDDSAPDQPARTPARRDREIAAAERELAAVGIG